MPSRLVDPEVLGRVSRLELVARHAVEGFLAGRHPSPYFGSSVEYADHRPYTLGDEIRSIDWKLLAKTDKTYIKLFAEQTNTRCTLMVDCSASMGFGGEASGATTTKLTYAFRLSAALAYLLLRQNDAVGMALFDAKVRTYLPARSTASHFRLMVDAMEAAQPTGDSGIGAVLHELAGRVGRRGLIVLVSDLLDDPKKIADGLGHFRFRGHDVIVVHVMAAEEIDFPYEKLTRFKDIEGASAVIANPRNIRKRYLERLNEFLEAIRGACFERGIDYLLARTDTPYDQALSMFLEKRMRHKKG